MKRLLGCSISFALACLIASGSASALTWTTVWDPTNDEIGPGYQVYGMSYAFDQDNTLYYSILTNFPEAGRTTTDSYGGPFHLSPGDLWINAAGTIYGLAFSTHANVVQQAYSDVWPTVTKGNLYKYATFADGTLEQYEAWVLALRGILPTPSDGDQFDGQNKYPTLIKGYSQEIAGQSNVQWVTASGQPWAYEIVGSINTAAIGLDAGETVQLFWSMECGNDAAMITTQAPIPEPGTFLLLSIGIFGLRIARRPGARR
ncbi:MAG: PEP-CTERM sorting domain-containing protein [Planctomycetes bacterium]|nr:PEP-CTERM sorting domain-containing protein [Planctomycetota bacterium]